MEKKDLKEFSQVLGSVATIEILTSIKDGKNQYKDFMTLARTHLFEQG